jgi:hypothetical protein
MTVRLVEEDVASTVTVSDHPPQGAHHLVDHDGLATGQSMLTDVLEDDGQVRQHRSAISAKRRYPQVRGCFAARSGKENLHP